MKQLYKRILTLVVITLSLSYMPILKVQAQDIDFSEVITERSVHAPLLSETYQLLKTIIEDVDFKDFDNQNDEASSVAEVSEVADEVMGHEGTIIEVTESEQLLAYYIEGTEEFAEDAFAEDGPVTKDVEVGFLFNEDELIGAITTVANFSLEEENFLDAEEIGDWLDNEAKLTDIELPAESVFSYSYVEAGGIKYSALMVSTLDAEENYSFDNMLFEDDVLRASPYFYINEFEETFLEINLLNLISHVAPNYFDTDEDDQEDLADEEGSQSEEASQE